MWTNATNWIPVTAPTASADTQLTFGSSPITSLINDIGAGSDFILNGLTFTERGAAYTLNGNALDFRTVPPLPRSVRSRPTA